MRTLMDAAFNDGELEIASTLAVEYLALAEKLQKDWNYGNAIHHANLMLDRTALQRGDIEGAKEYLIKA